MIVVRVRSDVEWEMGDNGEGVRSEGVRWGRSRGCEVPS